MQPLLFPFASWGKFLHFLSQARTDPNANPHTDTNTDINTDIKPGNDNPNESIVDAYNSVKANAITMAEGGASVKDVVEKVFEDTFDELEAFNAELFVNENGG